MPPESVSFAYNGSDTATATITNAQVGNDYRFACGDPSSSSDYQTAVGTTLVLTSTGVGAGDGDTFYGVVDFFGAAEESALNVVGTTVFQFGTPGEYTFSGEWAFDGDKTVTFTFNSEVGRTYQLSAFDSAGAGSGLAVDGTGGEIVVSYVAGVTFADDYFWAFVEDTLSGNVYTTRLFSAGVAGEGFLGNPLGEAPDFSVIVLDRPVWKWVVVDLRTSRALTWLTTIATDITTSRILAAAWPASLTVPSDDPRVRTTYEQFEEHPEWDEPFVAHSIRALIGFRDTGTDPLWEVAYTGVIRQPFDTVDDGVPRTRINAWDARKYLEFLPLVDADGNLPGEDGLAFDDTANAIARAALENWITNNPGCLAETLFDLTSGLDEDCAVLTPTFGRGTTINDVWTQLEQAGAIDIVLDPVWDPRTRPGCLAVVNFEVEHGRARPAAIFSWDRSPRSLPSIGRLEDGLKLANTIQDYTGDVEPADAQSDTDSVTKYGEYWSMTAHTDQDDVAVVAAFAAEEILFRKDGQTTVSASVSAPRALQPIQEYDIGDRVPVYASERLRKPIASTMRVYGIPFTIDESAHEQIGELIVSADAVA